MRKEIADAKAEALRENDRLENQKAAFAGDLKAALGAEIKTVLLQKQEEEKNPPKVKKGRLKNFFKRLAQVWQ